MHSSHQTINRNFLVIWSTIRLFAVTLLWINVLIGYLINVFLDTIDGDIFEKMKIERKKYQTLDKWLDLWFYLALLFFIVTMWDSSSTTLILILLFLYRLLGMIFFFLFKKEWLLFIFADIFSVFFFVMIAFPNFVKSSAFVPEPYLALLVASVITFIREWWVHIAKFDFTDLITGKTKLWK